jgi:hypothetical protein
VAQGGAKKIRLVRFIFIEDINKYRVKRSGGATRKNFHRALTSFQIPAQLSVCFALPR